MSLYGVMRTGASGMNAQANRLSTVADNVANVNTTGYKGASTEFSSLLLSSWDANYESGAVLTRVRHHISQQGGLTNTSSASDLGIGGNGFFVVSSPDGTPYLTRAGNFVPDADGALVNAAGFTLMGYRLDPTLPDVTVNGFSNLTPLNLSGTALSATPSTAGSFKANLPSQAATIPSTDLPSLNTATSSYTAKSSLIVYDNLGGEVKLDIYLARTGTSGWEMSVFDSRTAASGGGFPYSSGALASQTLTFGPTGKLAAGQPGDISLNVPGGATLKLDISQMTQLASPYNVSSATVNGTPAGEPKGFEFARDGFVYASYDGGARIPVYRIPLAHVMSPDMLAPLAGNVFTSTSESGNVQIGFPQSGGLGDVISGTLEQSTVDLAGELTTMIDAQRGYTANSKVFQTGSELMDVLVNLKR